MIVRIRIPCGGGTGVGESAALRECVTSNDARWAMACVAARTATLHVNAGQACADVVEVGLDNALGEIWSRPVICRMVMPCVTRTMTSRSRPARCMVDACGVPQARL